MSTPPPNDQNPQNPQDPQNPGDGSYGYTNRQYGIDPERNREPAFFQALFDLSFKNFVTIKFARIIYVVGLVLIVLGWLIFTVAAFTQSAGGGLLALILGAVVAFFYILLFRLTLEFYVAMVRTAQNTTALVERMR